jgi:polyribonucleotide nucleotidyltransferase
VKIQQYVFNKNNTTTYSALIRITDKIAIDKQEAKKIKSGQIRTDFLERAHGTVIFKES